MPRVILVKDSSGKIASSLSGDLADGAPDAGTRRRPARQTTFGRRDAGAGHYKAPWWAAGLLKTRRMRACRTTPNS